MSIQKIIQWVKSADIKEQDWEQQIDGMLESEWQKGYFAAKLEAISNSLSSDSEDFRWEIVELLEDMA